ncbi:ribosome small subunit-dependent GTPase A [Oscillospiraceae bacterium OttesenSCG-928-F05]|nr:ribosome small subunit-dependent GTPase A [Oscillospiraceae bacterium OttesenSCG-928-F05]
MTERLEGRIMKGIGGFYTVETASGIFTCRARGKFRKEGIKPMVGDRCEISNMAGEEGYLAEILPRRNSFIRPAVANIDRMLVVVSAAPPATDPFLIDRILSVCIHKGIAPAVVLNKCDLDPADGLLAIYQATGIPCFRLSAATGEGCGALLAFMEGQVSAFTGNSGVGKSSILNALKPGMALEVGALQQKTERGKHTTRHVELYHLTESVVVADTPGFSSFDTEMVGAMQKEALAETFPEFRPHLGQCRFVGCAHLKEANCAVRRAVEAGEIHKSRYESYERLYDQLKEKNPWE